MLELTTDQCSGYVDKIVSLAESAGCRVCARSLSLCLSALRKGKERKGKERKSIYIAPLYSV